LDFVLYELSYQNLILYGAVLPSYSKKSDKEKEKTINADDPKNRDIVRKELFG